MVLPLVWGYERGYSPQTEMQTYPDNSDRGIYGSNTRIDDHVYQDYTSCTGRYHADNNNYALSSLRLRGGGAMVPPYRHT